MIKRFAFILLLGLIALFLSYHSEFPIFSADDWRRVQNEAVAASSPEGEEGKGISLAERIARLRKAVETDKDQLRELTGKLQSHEAKEFHDAGEAFQKIDDTLQQYKAALEEANNTDNAERATQLQAAISEVEKKWKLGRERFNIAIELRKTLQEQIATLKSKIEQDTETLDNLLSPKVEEEATSSESGGTSSTTVPASSPSTQVTPSEKPEGDASKETSSPSMGIPGMPSLPSSATTGGATSTKTDAEAKPDKELIKAREEAAKQERLAKAAEKDYEQLDSRLKKLDRSIELEQQSQNASRKLVENSAATLQSLNDQYQEEARVNRNSRNARDLAIQIADAQKRMKDAQADVDSRSLRMEELLDWRDDLLQEKTGLEAKKVEEKEKSKTARNRLSSIENPLSVDNIIDWIVTRGPKLLFVLIAVFILQMAVRFISRRIVKSLVHTDSRGPRVELENRSRTLVGVFQNAALTVLYIGGGLMLFEVIDVPVGPLLGGAAVAGVAVAFGAQNLIKDYFSGFMILLENQYGVNDVVSISGVTGMVERITLRITVIRDFNAVHFIPHGQVTIVSNLTHKWSRAVFEIGVGYKEDVDRVIQVLKDLGAELRDDSEYEDMILDDPEMLGVDALGESAVVIKFFIKTQATKQWAVKRELLRRIKNRFDQLGIEIPYPHRTIYSRYEKVPDKSSDPLADA